MMVAPDELVALLGSAQEREAHERRARQVKALATFVQHKAIEASLLFVGRQAPPVLLV
jgi:hypothetical protein